MENINQPLDEMENTQNSAVSSKLKFLWGQYVSLIHLIITLSTGTLLIFFNSIKLNAGATYTDPLLGKFGVLCAVVSLVASFVWRFTAQLFMEKEVFGKPEIVKQYLTYEATQSITTSYKFKKCIKVRSGLYKVSQYLSCAMLCLSWCLLIAFMWNNI